MNLFFQILSLQLLISYLDNLEFEVIWIMYFYVFFCNIIIIFELLYYIFTFNLLFFTYWICAYSVCIYFFWIYWFYSFMMLVLNGILLNSSVNALCSSLLNLWCAFNIKLWFFMNSLRFPQRSSAVSLFFSRWFILFSSWVASKQCL